MAGAFAAARLIEPRLPPGLAPFAPFASVALVFGAAFLLLRLRERLRAAPPPGLPLEAFLEAGGVIAPHIGEAARARALSALRGLARREDVLAVEVDPEAEGAADAVTILTSAPAHLVEAWEARLGAEAVGSLAAKAGARRVRFVWD